MGAHRELERPFSPGPTMVEFVKSKAGSVDGVCQKLNDS